MKKDVLLQEFQKAEKLRNYEREPFDNTQKVESKKEVLAKKFLEYQEKGAFVCTPFNKPPQQKITITFNETIRVGSPGNITSICSNPGAGKSAVCEDLASTIVANILGINNNYKMALNSDVTSVLYFDTERSNGDIYESYERVFKRLNIPIQDVPGFNYINLRGLSTLKDQIEMIKDTCLLYESQLIIIDNIADLVLDTNGNAESTAFVKDLSAFINNYDITLLTTIHTNPETSTNKNPKPRGHIGTQILIKSESVLKIGYNKEQDVDNPEAIRSLGTKGWRHGKVRSDIDQLESYFKFDPELKLFVTCDAPDKDTSKRNESAILDIMDGKAEMAKAMLNYALKNKLGIGEDMANKIIDGARKKGMLVNRGRGVYVVNPEFVEL